MKRSTQSISILVVMLMLISANVFAQKASSWTIPDNYKNMKTTLKAGDVSISTTGKELYNKHCKSCHGTKGLGDGPKAAMLKTKMPSLVDAKFKAQTDGEIYYQSIVGKDEMPNYEKKIVDEADRWALVGYIRSLK